MRKAHELSHQFAGEPSLDRRLAATTQLLLDREGENVALDYDAEHAHQHLMLSPPHRANLLNPAFNVVGMGVVRAGDQLYIVEDFGHAVSRYSAAAAKDRIAAAVNQVRRRAREPDLQRSDLPAADGVACSMAQADKLRSGPIHELGEPLAVLSYTSFHPETLPAGASHEIASRNPHSFSIGACYKRTKTYPTGAYWVVLSLQ